MIDATHEVRFVPRAAVGNLTDDGGHLQRRRQVKTLPDRGVKRFAQIPVVMKYFFFILFGRYEPGRFSV